MSLRFTPFPSPAGLERYVRCLWALEGETAAPRAAEPVFPDGSMELVFHRGEPFEVESDAARFEPQPRSLLVGQLVRPLRLRPPVSASTIGVSFEPAGASALLGLGASSVAGERIDLETLLGRAGRELGERACEARSLHASLETIATALRSRLGACRRSEPCVEACVARIRRSGGTLRVRTLAREAGVGERRLERAFAERVGLGPKAFSRIVRFQTALRLLRGQRRGSLADVASTAGYFDQAHFHREFRRFAGMGPGDFRRDDPSLAGQFSSTDVGFVQDAPSAVS